MQKRKMKESNLEYNILRFAIGATFSDDPPDQIIDINGQKENENNKQDFASIGLAADADLKNPNIKVFDSTKEGGGE